MESTGPGGASRRRRGRDRRGRGMRGPAYGLRGSVDLAPHGVPADLSGGEHFDRLALEVMQDLWHTFPDRLGPVELGVEEVPILPERWDPDSVPLSSYVEATPETAARIVLLRRPIEHRAASRHDLAHLVLTVLVDQAAEVLGMAPEDVHPDYHPEDPED